MELKSKKITAIVLSAFMAMSIAGTTLAEASSYHHDNGYQRDYNNEHHNQHWDRNHHRWINDDDRNNNRHWEHDKKCWVENNDRDNHRHWDPDNRRWVADKQKGHSQGEVNTAGIVGAVIGAIIAKNT